MLLRFRTKVEKGFSMLSRLMISTIFLVALSALGNEKAPKGGEPGWEPPPKKEFSVKQKKEECKKYEGKLISFYQDLFKVENCKRRQITDETLVAKYLSSDSQVYSVGNETIIMLELGSPLATTTSGRLKCSDIEGGYVTTGGDSLYFVEKCKLRKFKDWESFSSHRASSKLTRRPIVELSIEDKKRFSVSSDMPSVFNSDEMDLSEQDIDIIPLDEACRGLNGKMVSFYSRLYLIENCRKKEILDPDFGSRRKDFAKPVTELSSEQWLSLPEGKAIEKLVN